MGGCRVAITVAPIMVLVVMVVVLQSAEATTYKVGDESGWIVPSDSSFYSTWASKYTFNVNDILDFQFSSNHDVAEVSADEYKNCATNSTPVTSGSLSVTLNSARSFYFICTKQTHCARGQKLAVNVGSSGTPSSNSASSLAAVGATSVVYLFVYVFGLLN